MKRVLICLVLASVLVLGFAATAYAANWNAPSARDLARWNTTSAAFPTTATAGAYYRGAPAEGTDKIAYVNPETGATSYWYPGQWNWNLGNAGAPQDVFSVDVSGYTLRSSGADKYTYLSWSFLDNEVIANEGANSPHGDFQTATVKCAVCHNVHVAAPANSAVTANGTAPDLQAADTLLKFKAQDGCAYCHVLIGHVVNGSPKWGGMWPLPSASVYGHNLGTPKCSGECHAGVHVTNQDDSLEAIKGLMLTERVDYPAINPATGEMGGTCLERIESINASAAAAGFGNAVMGFTDTEFEDGFDASNTNTPTVLAQQREQAVGVFCGGCHFGSYAGTVPGASTSLINFSPTDFRASGLFSGHRTMASATDNWNNTTAIRSSGSSNGGSGFKIAWADAQNCKGCHDAWDGFGNKSFPHGWGYATPYASSFRTGTGPNGETIDIVNESMTGIWLLRGAYAGSTLETVAGSTPESRFLAGKYGEAPLGEGKGGSLSDGVCLKCHRSANSGVGITF